MSLSKKIRKAVGLLPVAPFDRTVADAVARVDDKFGDLPFMKADKAIVMANLIRENHLTSLLELGTFKGKSTAYLAALCEVAGQGHVTTIDRLKVRDHEPNVFDVLDTLELKNRVTVHLEPTSLTWRLMAMLESDPRPQFDFCYLDAGHTWDVTGFAFFLVDQLLAPGGWMIFDDLDWTITQSFGGTDEMKRLQKKFPQTELDTQQVRKVWELLVKPHPDYDRHHEIGQWGIVRKKPI